MEIRWSKEFEMGIPFVDADHKVLVNLIGQTSACLTSREDTQILSSILSTLVEYVDYHFSREEKMMELSRYKGLAEHKREHYKLANKVRAIHHSFASDSESVSAQDLHVFLNEWLIDHIMGVDGLYRDACANSAIAQEVLDRVPFVDTNIYNGARVPDWSLVRVMLVDDNANFIMLIRTILKAVGIVNIDCMNSPLDALDKLEERPADIVLCDCVMDEMSGPAFAAEVKARNIPSQIILLTGYTPEVLSTQFPGHEISQYLEKPVAPSLLLGSMMDAISAPQNLGV